MYRRSNYSKNIRSVDKKPNIENIKYFSITEQPLSLVGVSVKNIVSEEEYTKMRRACNRRAGSNCEICGKLFKWGTDFKKKIYVSETYNYNLDSKVVTFNDMLGLCWDCFVGLNPYIIDRKIEEQQMNSKQASSIISKRNNLMQLGGYAYTKLNRNAIFAFEYKGYKYINDFFPQILDKAISRGVRILRSPMIPQRMQSELYYHK